MKKLFLLTVCALFFVSCVMRSAPYQFDNLSLSSGSVKKPIDEAGKILSELGYPTKSVEHEMGVLKTDWHKFTVDKGSVSLPLHMRTRIVINAWEDGSLDLRFYAQSAFGTVLTEKDYQPVLPNMEDEVNTAKAEYKRVREALSKKFKIKITP